MLLENDISDGDNYCDHHNHGNNLIILNKNKLI